MTRLLRVLTLALLFTAALFAAEDLTGKWSGAFNITVDGQSHEDAAYMVFTQKGEDLTGTAGPNAEEQYPIANGKVKADKATFDVQHNDALIHIEVALKNGHLVGEAKAEQDGHTMTATIDIQRVKN